MVAGIELRLARLSAGLDRLCSGVALFALGIMLLSILLQIVARYVFDAPPPWTEELARYAMIWSGMLGATMAYYRRADPVVFKPGVEGRPRRAFLAQSVEFVALIIFVGPVLCYAPGFLQRHAHRITETLEINSDFVVVIIPLSLAILVVHQSARVAAALRAALASGSP